MKRIGVKGEIVTRELPKLTDEVISELWHQANGQIFKFAHLIQEWLVSNASR